MSKVIILVGIPGIGKSTLASKLEAGGYVRLSADAIRGELYGDENVQGNQSHIFGILYDRYEASLRKKKNIVIDNTNINKKARRGFIQLARDYNYDIFLWLMPLDVERAVRQNSERARQVPEEIIRKRFKALLANLPTETEGTVVRFKK